MARRKTASAPEHPELLTRAEHSRWTQTSTHAEVESFCRVLAGRSRRVRLETMGTTPEGRDLPVLVLASGGAFTPESARAKGRAIVLVQANIHAGEVEGKETLLMLARELALAPRLPAVLKKITLVLVPDFNADGNDRISTHHRRLDLANLDGQIGPEGGAGTRYTGEGWNLNRDAMKQDAVESRLAAALFRKWWPHLFVDCHTTDGSIHGYDLTFDTSHNPRSGHPAPIAFTRDRLLPAVAERLLARTGIHTTFYGNWVDESDPGRGWHTYPALPRFGSHYRGLTGRCDVLLEAYSYIDFEARGRAMLETLRELLDRAAAMKKDLVAVCDRAERETVAAGRDPDPDDTVGVDYGVPHRTRKGALEYTWPAHDDGPITIRSTDLDAIRAHRLPGTKGVRRKTWTVPHLRRFVPRRSVARPWGYLVPAWLAEHLDGHGIAHERLGRRGALDIEAQVVVAIEPTHSPDVRGAVPPVGRDPSKRDPVPAPRTETVLTVRPEMRRVKVPASTRLVRTAQPLANLAIYLLEPEADDGLARWGFLDEHLGVGEPYPVYRVLSPL